MPTETLASITVNGDSHDAPAACSLADVLRQRGVDPEQTGIPVACNGAVVRRAEWPSTRIESGDEIEIITATQGG